MIYTENETALLEAGLEGNLYAALEFLEQRCPVNELSITVKGSITKCVLTVWPGDTPDNDFYRFETTGETIPECIVLAVREYDRYRITGTNYQVSEMG